MKQVHEKSIVAAEPIRLKNVLEFLRKPRVLIADDDPATSSSLSTLAGSDNYEIVAARDGAEAYRLLRSDADFCAAVINVKMPNIQGLDILRHMKTEKRLQRIPVIVVAAGEGLKLIAESFSAGAVAFLPKPFVALQLERLVRMVAAQPLAKQKAA
jgi:CheY-like chemotaxis protein